jgi:hypothetical protein
MVVIGVSPPSPGLSPPPLVERTERKVQCNYRPTNWGRKKDKEDSH